MIRYDKRLNQEIYETVYRYNKKIKSLSAKNIIAKLPPIITTKDLKTKDPTKELYSQNRRELRARLKQMKAFLKPGAEAVIVTPRKEVFTKWEFHNLQMQRRTAINRIKKDIKRLEDTKMTYAGQRSKYSYAQMGSQQYLNLLQKLEYLNTHELDKVSGEALVYYRRFVARNSKPRRDREWKENFLDIVLNLGYEYNYDVSELRKELTKLSVPEFINLINEERLLKDLIYYYKLLDEPNFDKNLVEEDVGQLINAVRDALPKMIENVS